MKKTLALLSLSLVAILGLSACAPMTASETAVAVAVDSVVIDVRTPAEYAEGHLEGAVLIDVTAPTFDAEISALATDESYVVYCRSGNRAATAEARMRELGFEDVSNAGSLAQAAASTGLAIVTSP